MYYLAPMHLLCLLGDFGDFDTLIWHYLLGTFLVLAGSYSMARRAFSPPDPQGDHREDEGSLLHQ